MRTNRVKKEKKRGTKIFIIILILLIIIAGVLLAMKMFQNNVAKHIQATFQFQRLSEIKLREMKPLESFIFKH